MSPLASQKRLQIIHLIWLGLVIVAIAAGALARVPFSNLLIVGLCALLPGIVGAWLLGGEHAANRNTEGLLVIFWTILATIIVAITGSVASPLTVLFAIAPLIALNFYSERMALEAAFFGVFAYFCMALMGGAGLLPAKTATILPLATMLVLSCLFVAGTLVLTLLKRHAGAKHAVQQRALADDQAEPSMAGTDQAVIHLPPDLPEHSGVMLLDVAGHGRITRVVGDRLGLGGVYPGVVLSSLFSLETDMQKLAIPSKDTDALFELANGRKVRAQIEAAGTHRRILLVDLSDMSSALEAAQAGEAQSTKGLHERTAFFASLGHELKTPLNAILGYADMMRAGIRGPMPDVYADYPDIIHESGQDLLLLVEDILDLAKADADRLQLDLEPIDLAASAQSVMRQLENQAERAQVRLELDAGDPAVWAMADARAVRQIWQNLLSNAIKYSRAEGVVVLRTKLVGGRAQLSVSDTGEGMSKEDLDGIMEPFTQGENARGRAGTGLGLAVVNSFAALHGGDVKIESRKGRGTQICVNLPLADAGDVTPLEEEES